jgi:hypothetical protein
MRMNLPRPRWLLAGTALALTVGAVAVLRGRGAADTEREAAPQKPPSRALPPPARLRIYMVRTREKPNRLVEGANRAWAKARPTALLLKRTPRVYQTEPVVARAIPACEVRALRAGGRLYLRLQWDDPTRNAPRPPPRRTGGVKHLRKRPTGHTASFPDAAAVMVPEKWSGPAFPSLLMGDKKSPVHLYYWNASRGAEVLAASGRATPQPTGKRFPHRARHDGAHWTLTLALPAPPAGYPLAFAVWDGGAGDRDGLKFFSVWYVLTEK